MNGRTFSDADFSGTHVRFPIGLADRLVVAARNHLERLTIYVDPEADPASVIDHWLASLEQVRTQPTPSAEPGDLLVKLARAEFWTFTAAGWRELAPVELQPVVGYDRDFLIGHREQGRGPLADPGPADQAYEDLGGGEENVERPFESLGGEPGVAFKRFRHVHVEAPRFYGKSVVEGVLEERDIERLWPPVKRILDDLLLHAETLDLIAQGLTEGPDGGNADPLYTAAGQAVSFARALEYARKRLLTAATDELRSTIR